MEPSHVLQAMGLAAERVNSSLRISLGHATNEAEIDRCAQVMANQAARLRLPKARPLPPRRQAS